MQLHRNNTMGIREFLREDTSRGIRWSRKRIFRTALRSLLALMGLSLLFFLTLGSDNLTQAVSSFFDGNQPTAVFSAVGKQTSSAFTGIRLTKKPSFPGCSSLTYRKMSPEQIASLVRPSVVGIIQYEEGSLKEAGQGSGIIMSSNGYILTNNHVVGDSSCKLVVVLSNGKRYSAALIGCDARTDIAVIKIREKKLQSAQFGDSGQCRVGEQVEAIGNPSGITLAGSITQGIISALNRNVDVGNGPMNLIQTDAAINPGNSGGALVNMYGQVIGVNSAKISQEGYEGIGFSIPINTVKPIVASLLKYGYVRGRLKFGFNCIAIDKITAEINDIPPGIYVEYVEPGGSADTAGLKVGDIITKIGGNAVLTTGELLKIRDSHQAGDTLLLTVYRRSEKKELVLPLTLSEEQKEAQTMASGKTHKTANW